MEDECDSIDTIRDAYERAIANVPPLAEKRSWRRYIYLWINYAIFEELQAKVNFFCFPPPPFLFWKIGENIKTKNLKSNKKPSILNFYWMTV